MAYVEGIPLDLYCRFRERKLKRILDIFRS